MNADDRFGEKPFRLARKLLLEPERRDVEIFVEIALKSSAPGRGVEKPLRHGRDGKLEILGGAAVFFRQILAKPRPRRFGKSMAMDMLSAYYNCGEDTSALFENLKISSAES